MKILLAESKTMHTDQTVFPSSEVSKHTPRFEAEAASLMESISGLSAPELAKCIGISARYAATVAEYVYDFPDKERGLFTLDAYDGVVFRNVSLPTLSDEALQRAMERVGIVSSLYGLLRLDDIIKPYRFDYTTRLPGTDSRPLYAYWRPKLTVELIRELDRDPSPMVVNLLPADALKCFDKKLIKSHAPLLTIDFKQVTEGNTLKTPNAIRLKQLRGLLLRQILEQNVTTPEEMRTLASPDYFYAQDAPYPDILQFIAT